MPWNILHFGEYEEYFGSTLGYVESTLEYIGSTLGLVGVLGVMSWTLPLINNYFWWKLPLVLVNYYSSISYLSVDSWFYIFRLLEELEIWV